MNEDTKQLFKKENNTFNTSNGIYHVCDINKKKLTEKKKSQYITKLQFKE